MRLFNFILFLQYQDTCVHTFIINYYFSMIIYINQNPNHQTLLGRRKYHNHSRNNMANSRMDYQESSIYPWLFLLLILLVVR